MLQYTSTQTRYLAVPAYKGRYKPKHAMAARLPAGHSELWPTSQILVHVRGRDERRREADC